MTTSAQDTSRPNSSHHRLSLGANASSLPSRSSYSRSHSHTATLSTVAPHHRDRVSRRKSSTFSSATTAANMGVAVEHATEKDGSLVGKRRSSISRAASGKRHDGHHPPMPRSLPHHLAHAGQANSLVEGTLLSSLQAMDKSKNHTRRMSDASRLSRKDKTGELKCEHCGKAYKHGSCLNKHL